MKKYMYNTILFVPLFALLVLTSILFIHATTNAQTPSIEPINTQSSHKEPAHIQTPYIELIRIITRDRVGKYNNALELEWGGGDLLHLKERISIAVGCIVDNIKFYDKWNFYGQYAVVGDAFLVAQYEPFVPAGTVWVECRNEIPIPSTSLPLVLQPLNLQPTEIIADVPQRYNTTFFVQWGGGSLLHFKGRLATMGCMVNNISFIDPATRRKHTYNQYNTHSTDPTNQQFLRRYEQFLPAGSLWVDCYNVCRFGGQRCSSLNEILRQFSRWWNAFTTNDTSCTDDFHPIVQEKVLPMLPIRPDACIIRIKNEFSKVQGVKGVVMTNIINTLPVVAIFDSNDNYRSETNEHSDLLLHTEIHELCHINQQWHRAQQLRVDNYAYGGQWKYFENSAHAKEFMEIVEYNTVVPRNVPMDSPYRNIYNSQSNVELSAELCALYILDAIGANSTYNYREYNDYFQPIPIRNFDTSPYLTPEIVEWLETYMILPHIAR